MFNKGFAGVHIFLKRFSDIIVLIGNLGIKKMVWGLFFSKFLGIFLHNVSGHFLRFLLFTRVHCTVFIIAC